MKIYKEIAQTSTSSANDADGSVFYQNLNYFINSMQKKGLTVEVQYSISATDCVLFNSALVLGYTEE